MERSAERDRGHPGPVRLRVHPVQLQHDRQQDEHAMTRLTRRTHRTRGQALVEFALIFPLLAIVIFGIIDFGRYVATSNSLSNSAREAARVASVGLRPSPQCDGLSRENCAISVADSNAWFIAPPAIDTTVTCERPGASGTTPIAIGSCRTNDFVIVHTQSVFTPITPLIGQFIGGMTLTGETRMVVNQ